jgi:hypothetical protein
MVKIAGLFVISGFILGLLVITLSDSIGVTCVPIEPRLVIDS